MDTLGDRIKRKRKELGLNQKDLSGPHLSHANVSLIERGKSNPSLKTLEVIAEKLNVDVNELLNGNDSKFQKNVKECLSVLQGLIKFKRYTEAKSLFLEMQDFEMNYQEKGYYFKLQSQVYIGTSNYDKALEKLNSAMLYLTPQQLEEYVEVYYLKAECYKQKQNFNQAIEAATNGLLLLKSNYSNENHFIKLKLLYLLSFNYCRILNFQQGLATLNEAFIYMREHELSFSIEKFFMLKGLAYLYLDEYHKGIKYTKKAILFFKEDSDIRELVGCYTNLGILYRQVKEDSKSIEVFEESLKLSEENNLRILRDNNYFELALTNISIKQYSKAQFFCEEIIEQNKSCITPLLIKSTLLQAYIKLQNNLLDEALAFTHYAEDISNENEFRFIKSKIYSMQAKIYREKGQMQESFILLEKALKIYEQDDHNHSMKFFNEVILI